MDPFWSVIRTHPNCEKIAIRNLENQKFDYYQPKLLEQKKVRQVWKPVEAPLFPNYLFVRIVNRWNVLNSTYGVSSVICNGLQPAIVRDQVIDDLKRREDPNGFIQLPKLKKFEVGDQVKILHGPFASQSALVERMDARGRQQVLLMLLDNKIKILINEENLRAA